MTKLNGYGYISITQLVIYVPCLALAFFICLRHGFKRTSGWLYTLLFCGVRIAGAICQLCTYNNDSSGLLEAVVIIGSIGLAPLLLAALGMLHRFHDFVNSTSAAVINNVMFRVIQLVLTIALVLAVVGGAKSNIDVRTGTVQVQETSKAGIVLFVIGWAMVVAVTCISFSRLTFVPNKERLIPTAIALALPLLFVRLLYSILIIFVNNTTFNLIGGSIAAKAAMETVEEFLATFIYLFLGFYLPKLSAEQIGAYKAPQRPVV